MTSTPLLSELPKRFATSATVNPRAPLDDVLTLASRAGFRSFEVMTDWAASAFDVHAAPAAYVSHLERHGLSVSSFHLPRLRAGDASSHAAAASGLSMAAALGASVVILKADSIDTYGQHSGVLLDQAESLGLQVVLTNHKGSAISTLEDYEEALSKINDSRVRCLLEVGHFAAVGVDWRGASQVLGSRIGLVHIKDIREGHPTTYGTGEVNFRDLFRELKALGYAGTVVVEIEGVADEAVERELLTAVRVVAEAAQVEGFQ